MQLRLKFGEKRDSGPWCHLQMQVVRVGRSASFIPGVWCLEVRLPFWLLLCWSWLSGINHSGPAPSLRVSEWQAPSHWGCSSPWEVIALLPSLLTLICPYPPEDQGGVSTLLCGFPLPTAAGCQGGGSPPLCFISTPSRRLRSCPRSPLLRRPIHPLFSQVCAGRPHSLPLLTDSTDFSGF